ncbi:MAG: DUF58 domain-containing protein [Ruminococcaceae bacterium]|nr:DUF58 domain-containing protein [Oscillospiraceae bacterium]
MNIIYILLALIAILAIEGIIYKKYWPRGIKAHIRFGQDRAVEGDTVELCQTLEYTGLLPLPWVRMKFRISRDIGMPDTPNSIITDYYNCEEVFSIGRMEKVTRRIPVSCFRRGQHRVFDVDTVSSDLFMTRKLIASFGGNSGITVYPRRTEIPQLIDAARQMIGEHIVRRSRVEDPFIFRGVRDYIEGDQLSHINWRATARTDHLSVNQYEYTSELSVSIWLFIEERLDMRDLTLTEECIRIAATMLGTLIDDGIPVALCCNAGDSGADSSTLIGHGCSPEHKDSCLTALARLDTQKEAMSPFEFADRVPKLSGDNELIILISSQTGEKLCRHIKNLSSDRELFWIAPLRSDDEQEPVGLEYIKNHRVWRVVCER